MVCLQKALHMRAVRTFKDDQGVVRKNGEEWLITMKHTDAHIPNVYEEVSLVPKIIYCNKTTKFCLHLNFTLLGPLIG